MLLDSCLTPRRGAFIAGSFEATNNSINRGAALGRSAMKVRLSIVITVIVLVTGSTLAIMNNACKSSHHTWCAPTSTIRHHMHTELK